MKKFLFLIVFTTIFVLLAGCSLYDDSIGGDVSRFIVPSGNIADDEFLPEHPVVVGSDNSSIPESDDTVVPTEPEAPEEGVVRTDHPALNGEYYETSGFRFSVPFLWREYMAVEITTEFAYDYVLKSYEFFYIPEEGVETTMMIVKEVPSRYYFTYGVSNTTRVATTSDNSKVYLLSKLTDKLPSGFKYYSEYLEIYTQLSEGSIDPIE